MRFLQVTIAYVGAQKKIMNAIHEFLLQEGNVSKIFFSDGISKDKNIVCYESKIDKLIRRGLRKILGKNPFYATLSTLKLIRKIEQYKPDLMHLHVLHHGYLNYRYLLKYIAKNNIPVVITMHDMWFFTGGCYYYTKENCTQFQTGCKECPANLSRLDNPSKKAAKYFALKKELISQLDKVRFVAVSQWVEDEMKKSFLSEYPMAVIENGMEPVVLKNSRVSNLKDDKVILISVAAAWDERKGIYRIFEIARILGDKYQFHLVGHANEELINDAPKNIHFLGYIQDKADLIQLYADADLHISASFEETFGMTFLEAAYVGTKSIGYATTAVKSTLQGVYGIAVSILEPEAMATEIQRVSKEKNMKLSQAEIESVKNRYSCDKMAKKYCAIYQEMLGRK